MLNLGKVNPGSTVYIPFSSFAGSTGASITLSGLAVTDVEVYKDGGTTQRASDNGYTLLDTDGIDFDGITGIHALSISLADNSTAGFWAAGSRYFVVISSVTIDSQTVNFIAATFTIGYEGSVLDTTIATLSSQTSFTLTDGPAEDDALNGQWVIIHDVASAVQKGIALVLDYTGSTKTVTLAAATTFTAAATDNISFMGPAPLQPTVAGRLLDVSSGGEAGLDWSNIGSPTTVVGLSGTTVKTATDVETDTQDIQNRLPAALVGGRIDSNVGTIDNNAITSSAIATDAIGSAELAASAVSEITANIPADVWSYSLRNLTGTRTGTAQAGAATTITLDSGASATNDLYKGQLVWVFSNTGAGQVRRIVGYVGATKVATVDQAWATNPDNTSGFTIFQDSMSVDVRYVAGGAASTPSTIDSNVVSMADNVITSAKLATGAITSDELAASAITAIQAGLSTLDAAGVRAALGMASANLDNQLTALRVVMKNTALANFGFVMTDSTNHVPTAGLTVTATRSIDGGAFAACTNSVTAISNGAYEIDLSAADLNGKCIILRFTATGADDRLIMLVTQGT